MSSDSSGNLQKMFVVLIGRRRSGGIISFDVGILKNFRRPALSFRGLYCTRKNFRDNANTMASVPLSKDYWSSSTPIQQSVRNCKRYLSSPAKEIDALSPIKANSCKNNLFQNLNSLDKKCDTSFVLTQLRRNKILDGVSRKLRFTELSNLIDVNISNKIDNDSGIGSDIEVSKTESYSVSDCLTSLSTDDNYNIISNLDNSSFKSHVSNNSLKIDSKTYKSEVLDNRRESYLSSNFKSAISSVDILYELNLRNCSGVLNLVLSCLTDEDVQKASCVSKEWRNIIVNDRVANNRRREYIKKKREVASGPEKENSLHFKRVIERSHKPVLLKVINAETKVLEKPKAFTQAVGKFNCFIQEAEKLSNEEELTKCPKCLYPSKVQSGNRNICTRYLCQHEFCKKCMGPYLDNHACSAANHSAVSTTVIVGSKQSKKNLRRL